MEAGNTGGFFEQLPPFIRLGADQRADPALAYQPGGMRAGRQIVEQGLHVPRPGFAPVDAID